MKKIILRGMLILVLLLIGCQEKVVISPEPETRTSDYECSYNKYNCADFNTQAEAQAVMIYCGNDDIHYLDGDDDGIACETLP